jgi:hypothetical protein
MERVERKYVDLLDVQPAESEQKVDWQPTTEASPDRSLKQRWNALLLGARERYRTWKKGLMERTDETLSELADEYVGDWQQEQPDTGWKQAQRAVDAARKSLNLKRSIDLAVRGSLVGVEFQAQMVAKQFLVDIAVRQADVDQLTERYGGQAGVEAVEAEAMQFADAVREHFAELQRVSERMMPEGDHDREAYRQKHIDHGMAYARQLLEGVTIIPEARRQAILADIRVHLDTELFAGETSSLWRGYDKISKQWRHSIAAIMKKHVDVYTTRKARNMAVATTAARWMTLGAESFLIGRASAAYHSVRTNYDQGISKLPAHERDQAKRLEVLAESVKTSLKQFALHDRFRLALHNQKNLSAEVKATVARLIAPEQTQGESVPAATQITGELWKQFGPELAKRGVTKDQLLTGVQDIMGRHGDHRAGLEHLLRYRLLALHRETVKATALQYEHLFQQFTTNIATFGMLEHIDETIAHQLDSARAEVDGVLSRLESGVEQISLTRVAHAEVTVPSLSNVETSVEPEMSASLPVEIDDQVPAESRVGQVHYVVEAGETPWKIASEHLNWYRTREDNPELTIPQAIELLARDNHLTDKALIRVGQELVVPGELPVASSDGEVTLPPGMWEQDRAMTAEQAEMFARAVDHQIPNEHYVAGATRDDLDQLPPGDYVAVFGERMGRKSGTMGVYYDQTYDIHVESNGDTSVKLHGMADTTPMSTDELLSQERSPVVRVFALEATELQVDHGQLQPETWSPYSLAMIDYLQRHTVRVVDKDGAYCAKDAAGRFNLVADQLAAEIGVNIIDGKGNLSGVTVHAPMIAEAIKTAGGRELASLSSYFRVDQSGSHPLERPETDNVVYRTELIDWVQQAARHPLEVATFFNTGTHIQDIIAANRDIGGEPASHVVTLLGTTDHHLTASRDTTMLDLLSRQLQIDKGDLKERGYVFAALGVEVNGQSVTGEADWLSQPVAAGSEVVVHDVATNHLYGGVRNETLLEVIVRHDNLLPVSVLQPNAEVVNAALAEAVVPGAEITINTFAQAQPGDTIGRVLEQSGMPSDLWKAAELALAEQGVTADSLEPGDFIPIFDDTSLRASMDDVYARAEARLSQDSGTYVHIVRPSESMDHITEQFFDHSRYSTAEWGDIRDQLAYQLHIPTGDQMMPGDMYTSPYRIHTYQLQADAVLQIDENTLAQIDRRVWEHRAAERVYLPDHLAIATEDGVVDTPLPAEVVRLIDTVVDANPNYGESVRTALALVYANEAMRETADLNLVSSGLAWVNTHLPDRSTTLDKAIAISEYLTSRQMLKDAAWKIQDEPLAKVVLDTVIAQSRQGLAERAAAFQAHPTALGVVESLRDDYVIEPITGKLETIAGVSSAGLFQIRANNFLEDGTPEFAQFEQALREDPLLNTTAAAELLHRNEQVLDSYVEAFHDPLANDDTARLLALANSHNGGPYKTMLGALQERLLFFERQQHVELPLDQANGRDTATTRESLIVMCDALRQEGKLNLAPDQVERDVAMLGKETVGFLRSETMQQLQAAYLDSTGTKLSILPTINQLDQPDVSYANYALLATRGGNLDLIQEHSRIARVQNGTAVTFGYGRNDVAPFSNSAG